PLVAEDGDPRIKPADAWLQSPDRRQFVGIICDPRYAADPSLYNAWRGFAVQPTASGSCTRYLEHLRANIARGNPEQYEWILAWMANLVQNPGVPGQVALVLRGERGTGKGVTFQALLHFFGEAHGLHLTGPGMLTARFNKLLAHKCFIFADETF